MEGEGREELKGSRKWVCLKVCLSDSGTGVNALWGAIQRGSEISLQNITAVYRRARVIVLFCPAKIERMSGLTINMKRLPKTWTNELVQRSTTVEERFTEGTRGKRSEQQNILAHAGCPLSNMSGQLVHHIRQVQLFLNVLYLLWALGGAF